MKDGDMRLADGDSTNEGRVEIFYRGQWGTVCDNLWDLTDASVVCRALGFENATKALGRAAFGPGRPADPQVPELGPAAGEGPGVLTQLWPTLKAVLTPELARGTHTAGSQSLRPWEPYLPEPSPPPPGRGGGRWHVCAQDRFH